MGRETFRDRGRQGTRESLWLKSFTSRRICMKKYSSILRLTWSIAYVILAILVIRGSIDTSRFWAAHASTQDPRKSIEEAFSVEPQIRLSKVMVGNVERRLKEEFDESDDWPKRLSLEVQSLATKPIVYMEINLNFPD